MLVDIAIIIFLFILPVILISVKIIPFKYKLHTLGLVALCSVGIVALKKWNVEKLGLSLHAAYNYALPYIFFTIGVGLALVIIAKLLKRHGTKRWWEDSHFIWGFIVVSILQEFIFRGFLIPELQLMFSSAIWVVLINALLFAFMHIIYSDDKYSLAMIFAGGGSALRQCMCIFQASF